MNSETTCCKQDQQYGMYVLHTYMVIIESSNPTPKYSLSELKIYKKNMFTQNLYIIVYNSFIHNYQRMKQSRFTSIDEWINKL